LPIEFLAATVLFDRHVGDFVNPLVGGESPQAGQTLAPAADGAAFLAFPGIHDLVM
jgi:hypothetical protein